MAKRFTATEKWSDPWFRKLPPEYKLFWIYICENCNNAGIWNVDFELADFQTGTRIASAKALEFFATRVQVMGDQYWLIKDFVRFQYGELSADSRPHQQVVSLLKKHGVSIGYTKGIYTLQDKDKDKNKDVDVKKGSAEGKQFKRPTVEEVSAYCAVEGYTLNAQKFCDFYESKGWMIGKNPMRDWRAAVRTWQHKSDNDGNQKPNWQ